MDYLFCLDRQLKYSHMCLISVFLLHLMFTLASCASAKVTVLGSSVEHNFFNPQDPSSICTFMDKLFRQSKSIEKYNGEVIPLMRGHLRFQKFKHSSLSQNVIYCLIPPSFSYSNFRFTTTKSLLFQQTKSRFTSMPSSVSYEQFEKACLLGCLKIPYEIKAANQDGTLSTIFVTVATLREGSSCPSPIRRHFIAQFRSSTPSTLSNLYAFAKNESNWKNCVPDRSKLEELDQKPAITDRNNMHTNASDFSNQKQRQIQPLSATTRLNGKLLCDSVSAELDRQYKRNFGKPISSTITTNLVFENRSRKNPTLAKNPISVYCIKPPGVPSSLMPTSSFSSTKIYCQFGCERYSYYFKSTGQIVQFVFAKNCVPASHGTCFQKYVKWLRIRRSPTNSPERFPVPSILHVTSYQHDRESVVRVAIKRLRQRPGFSGVKRYHFAETKRKKIGKNFFEVKLYFKTRYLEI